MKTEPVFIMINEWRAIKSDAHCWMIMRRGSDIDDDGQKVFGRWEPYKYPTTLGSAAKILEDEFIRGCGAQTIAELRECAAQIHQQLKEIFDSAESYRPWRKHDRSR